MSSSENIAWQVVNDITVYNNNYFNRVEWNGAEWNGMEWNGIGILSSGPCCLLEVEADLGRCLAAKC